MRRVSCLAAILVLLTFVAPGAMAAPAEPEVFNFEGDELSTDFLNPQMDVVGGLHRGRSSSLISIRLDFVAEIVKSAEDI